MICVACITYYIEQDIGGSRLLGLASMANASTELIQLGRLLLLSLLLVVVVVVVVVVVLVLLI